MRAIGCCFGPGPYLLGLRRLAERDGFPFDVLPAVEQVEHLRLTERVTLLAGDNGSGKSTILEAIARIGFAEQGGELDRLGELPAVPHVPMLRRRAGAGAERHQAAQRLLPAS